MKPSTLPSAHSESPSGGQGYGAQAELPVASSESLCVPRGRACLSVSEAVPPAKRREDTPGAPLSRSTRRPEAAAGSANPLAAASAAAFFLTLPAQLSGF